MADGRISMLEADQASGADLTGRYGPLEFTAGCQAHPSDFIDRRDILIVHF